MAARHRGGSPRAWFATFLLERDKDTQTQIEPVRIDIKEDEYLSHFAYINISPEKRHQNHIPNRVGYVLETQALSWSSQALPWSPQAMLRILQSLLWNPRKPQALPWSPHVLLSQTRRYSAHKRCLKARSAVLNPTPLWRSGAHRRSSGADRRCSGAQRRCFEPS